MQMVFNISIDQAQSIVLAQKQLRSTIAACTIILLLRPDEVLSGILDAPVLEVTHDALRVFSNIVI